MSIPPTQALLPVASSMPELGPQIVNKGGYDILKFTLQPGAKMFTNQETMSYMDGGLTLKPTLGNNGIFSAFARTITGSSFLQNALQNPTSRPLDIVLTPFLQGAVVQIELNHGDMWRFADKSFMACTSNLKVSGNINVFSNFRSWLGGQGLTYVTVSADAGPGTVWVSAYGGYERHEIDVSNRAFYINHGSFLGMLSRTSTVNYWSDYVTVGTTNGIVNAIFNGVGLVMKVQDRTPSIRGPATCKVLTQSLDRGHLESYIKGIANTVVARSSDKSAGTFFGNLLGDAVSSGLKKGGGDSVDEAPPVPDAAPVPAVTDPLTTETFQATPPLEVPKVDDLSVAGTRRRKIKGSKKKRATRRR